PSNGFATTCAPSRRAPSDTTSPPCALRMIAGTSRSSGRRRTSSRNAMPFVPAIWTSVMITVGRRLRANARPAAASLTPRHAYPADLLDEVQPVHVRQFQRREDEVHWLLFQRRERFGAGRDRRDAPALGCEARRGQAPPVCVAVHEEHPRFLRQRRRGGEQRRG